VSPAKSSRPAAKKKSAANGEQSFHAQILDGHKGAAVIVPFDPAKIWDIEPAAVPAPWKKGYLVSGKLNRGGFEGWIGNRWGRNFILVDDELLKKARANIGDVVRMTVSPRKTPVKPTSSKND
jgi:hypothetical protein